MDTMFEPIKITKVDPDRISPSSRGGGLLRVPIQLSRNLNGFERNLITKLWDNPPSMSTKHRPGIATVSMGDLWLDGVTLEEVRDVHARTVSQIIAEVNRQSAEFSERREREREQEAAEIEARDRHYADLAAQIKFDHSDE